MKSHFSLKFTINHLFFLCTVVLLHFKSYGQVYPVDQNIHAIEWESYEPPKDAPKYLIPFTDPITGNKVMRISDQDVFGCDCSILRHNYSKNQPWNADGTKILTAGSFAKVLDGNTFEVLGTAVPRSLWSNIDPNLTFGTQYNTFVKKNIVTNKETVLRTFSDYQRVVIGYNEGNISNDDSTVVLIGINGKNQTVLVYDILNDVIVGTKFIGETSIDWASISQSGQFVVIRYYTNGSGNLQGVKSYNRKMENEIHLHSHGGHADIGYDVAGNEVLVSIVGIEGYSLSYTRLDNGLSKGLWKRAWKPGDRGVSGGHVSTRNIKRPGWAYISTDQGNSQDNSYFKATKEVFAIKLDDSETIERFAKHNTNYVGAGDSYRHQAQAVPNRDGTKVMFASNWHNEAWRKNDYPMLWVVESSDKNISKIEANAGADITICQNSSTILTATGGSTYLWSTGETTASITVSPEQTTTYTLTAFDSNGENSDSDEVVVTVNPLPKVNAGSDVTINSGETVTLTASGAESYRWNTGATTQSIEVSPTSTTTYTVVGTTNGCEASDDVTVFSVEASVKANAGEDTEICSGSSATLTASGGSTYLWSTGATSASITVSPNETTTYSVTVYGNTEGNSDTDEVMVTVKPLPIVNAGSDITIEQGESAVLTATGATSYKWSNGMEGSSITVNPSSTRAYTVTGTNESGCEAKDTVRVVVLGTVEVIADAGKNQQICQGSSTTLTATGGATYLWDTGETTASITVNPNSTTTYSVTAYDASGNFSDTDDVIVTVNPLPVVSAGKNVTIYSGESTVLSATGANSYKWSTGDTGASVTVSPTTTQTYTVTGRSNGCEDTSTVSVVVLPAVEVIADAGKNQQICEGSSVTLNATGGATYLWSTGETTASITVSPNSTTKYTVTVYDDTGKFSDTDDVMVTVNPLPVINAGKNVTINSGESTILTATGATSYKWNTGAVGNKITVRPTVTTTYTVIGVSNGCEAVSTVTVTVKTPQKVVASAGKDQDICEGGSVKLTATGGETYLWSTGAKTPSITVSPKSTAKYSVTAYVGDVSAKAEVVVNVTANPKVKIANGSETSLLKGERVTLSASGAKTYKWNNGAVQPNITVIPNSTQTYKVTGFNDKCAAERSVKVNVLEKVVASAGKDVTIYRNEKTVLTATGPKGSEYLWSTGETTKSITVSPEESTVYSVMVYHALDSDTANVTVNVIDLVDEDILDDSTNLKFLIHPNPTNGELHVKVSGLTYLSSIHLYDLSGKSLYSEIINESDHHTYVKTLDLSNYATGIYLLQLVNNNSVITKKVVLR